jgi:hypothetical protein
VNILRVGSGQLNTSATQTSAFYPTSKSQWKSFTLNATPYKTNNVMFRVEFTYQRGNNIFIDDINIGNVKVGTEFVEPLLNNVQVFPNPTAGDAEVHYNLISQQNVKAVVYNITGIEVGKIDLGNQQPGKQGVKLSDIIHGAVLPEGVYLIRLQAGAQQHISKLLISR